MKDFIAAEDRERFERHGLLNFEALWNLQLAAVDEPNTARGGWSSVCRLELDGAGYYLKRQRNHLTRSLRHPFGEPTFARELRNIERYARLGIPALQAAYFAQRKVGREQRAILLTRALDGWRSLDYWLSGWRDIPEERRNLILQACGDLARRLHTAGQVHGCFYPKHIFLRECAGAFEARLIDLEKTRPLILGERDRIRDLEPLVRRADQRWGQTELRTLLRAYLQAEEQLPGWLARLVSRREAKEGRSQS